MILRRIEGHSWGEIASEFGLSNHAARVRFSKALQWLRTSVETSRNCSSKSTLRRSKKCHRPRDTKAQRVAAFERRLDRMFTPAFYRENGKYGKPLPSFSWLIETGKVCALNFPIGMNPAWRGPLGS